MTCDDGIAIADLTVQNTRWDWFMNISVSLTKLAPLLAALVSLSAPSLAGAAVINGNDFTQGAQTQTIGGLAWSIAPSGKTFQKKTMGTYTGVGISGGRTPDEIDIDEFLTGSSTTGFGIGSFRLGVLFDGPEFGDWNEIAQITAVRAGGRGTVKHTLRADTATSAVWSGLGTFSNLSPAESGSGAVWEVSGNPFGNFSDFISVTFTAKTSTYCDQTSPKLCNNQSDFTLVQMNTGEGGAGFPQAVPEPASLALVGLALLGMATARRRT
jgi:PEP-CTERM motif